MERFLSKELQKQVGEFFADMKDPVVLILFGSKTDCEYCADEEQLLGELAELTDKISLKVLDLEADAGLAAQYHVDKAPGLVIAGKQGEEIVDFGVRFYGMPAGHEFGSLANSILLVSTKEHALSEETQRFLNELKDPIHLMVFVTPT